jgi:hypothetical protein
MYHVIEFIGAFTVDVEVARNKPLERMIIQKGAQVRVELRPYVVETKDGPVEVADLFLEDGTAIRMVRFACFRFSG